MKNLKKLLSLVVIVLMSFNLFSTTITNVFKGQLSTSSSTGNGLARNDNLLSFLYSLDKRVIIAQVNDPNHTATAVIIIYSQDGQDQLGPYTVKEGTLLQVDIDEREWGVKIIQQSEGSEVTWWTEEE